MNKSQNVYIVAAARTAVGRLQGSLSGIRPDDLLADLILKMLDRYPFLDVERLEGLLLGNANQAGEDNRNLARMGVLLSGLPVHVYASTINCLCASGMDAVIQAARALCLGEGELYLAGGLEVMSRSPFVRHRLTGEEVDSTLGWRFRNPRMEGLYVPHSMSKTAELLAERWQISRERQDAYAMASRKRFMEARAAGAFAKEILPVELPDGRLFEEDEQARVLSERAMGKLPAVVAEGRNVTLGNSARAGDGGALLALASEAYVERHGLVPLARVHAWATAAEHPDFMGLSPVAALRKALRYGGLSSDEIGLWELQEAFAVQLLACQQALRLPEGLLNPYGGAISIGNPLGMGAARLLVSLVHALVRGRSRFAAGATCAGLGIGAAVILERC
jgi:acetyl-CoA acetyltransferase family protein